MEHRIGRGHPVVVQGLRDKDWRPMHRFGHTI